MFKDDETSKMFKMLQSIKEVFYVSIYSITGQSTVGHDILRWLCAGDKKWKIRSRLLE